MKITGFSDTHLPGNGLPGGGDPQWRQDDFLKAFNVVIEEIRGWEPDLIAFAGDAFRGSKPSPTWAITFINGLKLLAEKAPVVLIPGNHDLTSSRTSILGVLNAATVPNVHYIGEAGAIEINGAQVFGMPVTSTSWLTAARKKPTVEAIEREMEELAEVGIRAFLAQPFTGPRIFIGHLTMLGASFGGWTPVTIGSEVFWQSSWLDGFDAALLGHLHRHQFPDPSRPWIAYAGSTERLDFGERDEPKGWVSIDLSDEKPKWEFHEIPTRPMVQIEMMSTQEPFPDVHPDAILKVIVHLEAGQRAPDIEVDCRYILPPVFLWQGRERQFRGPEGITEMDMEEQLTLYWESRKIPAERQEVLMEYAKEVMVQ